MDTLPRAAHYDARLNLLFSTPEAGCLLVLTGLFRAVVEFAKLLRRSLLKEVVAAVVRLSSVMLILLFISPLFHYFSIIFPPLFTSFTWASCSCGVSFAIVEKL